MKNKDQEIENKQTYFRNQMRKAFQYGRVFFSRELGADEDSLDCPDDNLPFAEWFAKHYPNSENESLKQFDKIQLKFAIHLARNYNPSETSLELEDYVFNELNKVIR